MHSTAYCSAARSSGRRQRLWLLVCGVLLLVLLLPPAARAQDAAAVTFEIAVGYDGSYRVSQWFPVTITVRNGGPDVRGVLEWSYPSNSETILFQQAIDLPRGARKQVSFPALSNSFARLGEVRLRDGNQVVAQEEVRISPIEVEQFVVAVYSDDQTVLNSLSTMSPPNTSGTTVVRPEFALLPEQAMNLAGIDAIFLHNVATADLSDEQRAALEMWVRLGGSLVVIGGSNAGQTVPGLEELLPVEVEGLEPDRSLAALGRFAKEPLPDDLTTTINQVQLRPDAQSFVNTPLLSSRSLGMGQVIFSAFDVRVLAGWSGEPQLWEQVLNLDMHFAPAAGFRWQRNNLLFNVLQLPELSLPSFWVLALLVFGYIVAVGPLNFFVLRRLKRIGLAWITIPATVLIFVAVTYGASFVIRGFQPQVMQVAVVQGFEDSDRGQATSFLGVFSPRRRSYTLDFAPNTLVSSGRFNLTGAMGSDDVTLLWDDTRTHLRDVLVDVSSLRTFIVEQTVTTDVAVSSDIRRTAQTLEAVIENQGTMPLVDALLVSGNAMESIGTIQPGQSQQVVLERGRDNFPHAARLQSSEEELFDRQAILSNLFNFNRFLGGFAQPVRPGAANQSFFSAEHAYLLAWQERAIMDATLEDGAVQQEALTLHVIRLAE
jgi:hypothetical protein